MVESKAFIVYTKIGQSWWQYRRHLWLDGASNYSWIKRGVVI